MSNKKIINILLIIAVYLISTGVSYAFFIQGKQKQAAKSFSGTSSTGNKNGQLSFDSTLPKTEVCPLTGVLYPKIQKEWWEKHRPLGIMVENHQDARPQSGLSSADIIYEAVAEGGITRFLSLFYCQDGGEVGPIRSARTYFLDFISEYGDSPLYIHVGGANQSGPANALAQINDYGWVGHNDMNQFSIGFPTFWRDYDRLGHTAATEHTMYSTTEKLWQFAASQRGLSNVDKDGLSWTKGFVPYTFKEDASLAQRPKTQTIHVEFWGKYSDYFVDWSYNPITNLYIRNNGGKPQIDRDNNKQLTTGNIVVLFMRESRANDGYEDNVHLLYKTKGTGKAAIFRDGQQTDGTWRKDSRTARTLLFDSNGSPIKFDKGTIWFQILPADGVLTVK